MVVLVDLNRRLEEPAVRELLACSVGFPAPDRLERVYRCYRERAGWHLRGIEAGGTLIGCIGVEVTSPGRAVVRHIAVAPACRRQGLGRALLEQVATSFGLSHLAAETDQDAAGFYRHCAFSVESLGELYPGVERFHCERSFGLLDKQAVHRVQ